jgi:hypothetical protein
MLKNIDSRYEGALLAATLVLVLGGAMPAIAQATPATAETPSAATTAADTAPAVAETACESLAPFVKAVALDGTCHPTYSTFNFPADGLGHFDTLMSTTVHVGGAPRSSCLIATFSTQAYPLDNSIVFQVRVDGEAMNGHMGGAGSVSAPVVFDPEETDLNNPRMLSYTFFKRVRPGTHTVDVQFAGCCSGAPVPGAVAAYAGSPVLTLHHR